ncbi:MAG: ABC transporter substrate-binding protein [Leptolyngbyaceae cyanobacterium SL_7_1]|nr:ABC transporter substrate-binding protein [Leptolyngbyaceae cyanobacterium SL_7_1]
MPLTRSFNYWNRRQFLYFLSAVTGSVALHGCNQSTGSTPGAGDRLAASVGIVTWIGYTPIYIAKAKGFYEELGLDLDLKVFNSGAEAIAAFTAGQIDGLSLVPSEAVTVAANGTDYRVVYVVDTSNGGDGILARNSIKDVAAFADKQIAVEQGGVSHFYLLEVMNEQGLQESDVTLVNLTPDAAAAAYQAGKVDIAVTYAPFLFTANEAQKDGRILHDSSQLTTPTAIADLIIFDTDFIATNPEAVKVFIQANFKGLEFFQTHQQEGLAIAAENLGVTPGELAEQIKGVRLADLADNISMLNDPTSNLYLLTPLNSMVSFLENQEQIDQSPDLSNILDPQFVLAIQSQE